MAHLIIQMNDATRIEARVYGLLTVAAGGRGHMGLRLAALSRYQAAAPSCLNCN